MNSNEQRDYIDQMLQEADVLHQETKEGQVEIKDDASGRAESDEEVIDLGNNFNFLVNKDTKILAIMPCPANARDSFSWCSLSKGKRKPKQITCKLFFAKVFSMMGWNPDHRYKILGKLIHANGETLIAFDLTATEIYQRTVSEGSKPRTSRIPVFPAEWQNQFGLPYNEHKQSLQVDILNGYAVYSIKDSAPVSDPEEVPDGTIPEEVLKQLDA